MILKVIIAVVVAATLLLFERVRRRHEYLHGPHYVKRLQDWAEMPSEIKPLALPPVKELKASKVVEAVAAAPQTVPAGNVSAFERRARS